MTEGPLEPQELDPVPLVEVDDPGPEPPEEICQHGEAVEE